MGWQETQMDRYYRSRAEWKDGTTRFHDFIVNTAGSQGSCLEIGAGPGNATSRFLASNFSRVDGIDIDPDVRGNASLTRAYVYDGVTFPVGDAEYDCAVSNYVLEHIENPREFLAEVSRVLRPGGCFVFRTPNRWHYTSILACLIPNRLHDQIARYARQLPGDAHEAYPTYHRMNTRRQLRRQAVQAQFSEVVFELVETEPSYLKFHALAFRMGVLYERTVNRVRGLSWLRANIFGCMRKGDKTVV